jgi:hypothetical protein
MSHRSLCRRGIALLAGLAALAPAACGDDGGPLLPEGALLEVRFTDLPPLDPAREGTYALWVVDGAGAHHLLSRFAAPPAAGVQVASPVAGAVAVELTVQRPEDTSPVPSAQRLLRGELGRGRAELSLEGAVTQGRLPLRERPGQFTMYFTPSDNSFNGYPSNEEAGIWLFNIAPRETQQADGWVRLTPLQAGWVYEGWVVRDLGTTREIWLSYGKFVPDQTGAVNTRDDTGWGPFSGVLDYRTAGEEDYPGDDWISNPVGYPFPAELSLPLDLRERDAAGRMRWSHVITIEPEWNRGEPISTERPFLLRPYRDPFVERVAGLPRASGLPNDITFRPDALPGGVAEVR